jgi:peptidoglycan/LPS O-acetylase OafA/YrhL
VGIVRFLLAAVVVLFHTTNLNWIPGRMAVHGFFVLSGFVITRAVLKNYRPPHGTALRFYANRTLRLVPPYAIVVAATAGAIAIVRYGLHYTLVSLHPYFFRAVDADPAGKIRSSLTLADMKPVGSVTGHVPSLIFSPWLVPQAWSLGVECVFYAVAPLFALLIARWSTRAAIVILAVSLVPWSLAVAAGGNADLLLYRNAATCIPLFAVGALAATTATRWRLPPWVGLLVGCVYVLALCGQSLLGGPSLQNGPTEGLFLLWQGITVAAMLLAVHAAPWRGWMKAVDRQLGDLSYGVYIVHGLAILGLPVLSLAVTPHGWGGVRRLHLLAGAPYTVRYGIEVLVVTVALAFVLWRLVELPLTRTRARVRHGASLVHEPGAVSQAAEGVEPAAS